MSKSGEQTKFMSKSDLPNPDPNIKSRRNPIVAFWLSLILFGGSGHIYLGQIKKGLLLIVLTLFLWIFGLGWLVTIAGTLDAYILAKKLRKGQSIGEWMFFSRADLIELQNELTPNKWIITMIGFIAGVVGAALGLLPFGILHELLAGLLPDNSISVSETSFDEDSCGICNNWVFLTVNQHIIDI